eukprot:CAMPEP_0116947766 /NCGR_PEP_ID=MMETSP0467-20121206/37884_1 /TAXON_ID=283647 /ORGANISM="Mesodinium pulex, Strain SPMC105" /LENGTH=61 /DNA_ID=CAMNT_0004632013 /DNA_START=565 /DNA_END=750 /DNA_ORIENTATION=-
MKEEDFKQLEDYPGSEYFNQSRPMSKNSINRNSAIKKTDQIKTVKYEDKFDEIDRELSRQS